MHLPPFSLVIGGAQSGKSAFAERMVRASGLAKVYVATAEAHDADMATKIEDHRTSRAGQGWRTVEAPHDTARALAGLEDGEVALLDCVTFWLTNLMLADGNWQDELDLLCDVLAHLSVPVVAVSNDVSGGVVPETSLGRAFQRAQGQVNQRLAAQAALVVQVTVGIPTVLKGQPLSEEGW